VASVITEQQIADAIDRLTPNGVIPNASEALRAAGVRPEDVPHELWPLTSHTLNTAITDLVNRNATPDEYSGAITETLGLGLAVGAATLQTPTTHEAPNEDDYARILHENAALFEEHDDPDARDFRTHYQPYLRACGIDYDAIEQPARAIAITACEQIYPDDNPDDTTTRQRLGTILGLVLDCIAVGARTRS
jgi:hypothetical protein